MSNRIDLTQFEGISAWEVEKRPDGGYAIKTGRDNFSLEEAETIAKLPNLIAELKRMYEREDELLKMAEAVNGNLLALIDALQIIKEDLNEAMEYESFTVRQLEVLRSISNFANDISR